MAKLTLNTIGSRYGSIDALNDNFNAIETAIENTFSLDGTSPNALEADLDMNSNDILNAGEVSTDTLRINGVLVEPLTGVTAGAVFQTYEFTATAGQTSFSVSPATPYNASIIVIVNGLQLSPAEVSVSSTNVITPALTLGDEVVIRRYTATPSASPDATNVNFIQAGIGAVTRTSQNKMRDAVSVKDFGAVGDGITDDTVAIQAALDSIANAQVAMITNKKITRATLFFPEGLYLITNPLKVRGFIGLAGVGTAYTGGSVIRQMSGTKNIFEFYGSVNDRTSLGTFVTGLNFEFSDTLPDSNVGYALFYPRLDDVSGNVLSSNSHYIRANRFGGWHRQGRFIFLANSNDVEISSNVVDVCVGGPAIALGSQTYAGPSDVRIFGNNFFYCVTAIAIYRAVAITISNNTFSNQFNGAGWKGIFIGSDTGTITPGNIAQVVITSNILWRQRVGLEFDGSAVDCVFSNNVMRQCYDSPIQSAWAVDYKRWTISGNTFELDSTYPYSVAPLVFSGGGVMYDSNIIDNTVDAATLNTVTSFTNDNTTTSFINGTTVLRNNTIRNNTSVLGVNKTYLPVASPGLDLVASITSSGSFPSAANLLRFNTIAVGDYFTFDLSWEVVIDKSGVAASVRTGLSRVSVARLGTTLTADITAISSTATDSGSIGATAWPVATFTFTTAAPSDLRITVTNGGGIVAPADCSVRVRAYNFTAKTSCAALVKSV